MASKDDNKTHNQSLELQIQVPEDVQRGTYANQFISTHTAEEFILDFIMTSPPVGIVNARIVVAPVHAKRIATALVENIARYEAVFGEIAPATTATTQGPQLTH